jgi:hypothetical protein
MRVARLSGALRGQRPGDILNIQAAGHASLNAIAGRPRGRSPPRMHKCHTGRLGVLMTIRNVWNSVISRLRQLALATIGLGPEQRGRSPHVRLQDLERLSGHATLAIVAGIGIELVALFWLKREWNSDTIASIVADLLIFVGLIVEYLVIYETIEASRADRIESDREVANANAASRRKPALKSAPNILERLWRHRSVAHGIGDRGVPKEVLEAPRIHSPGRQRVPRRMPQHVDMHWKPQPSSLASPLYHASNTHPAERLATLIDKDVGPLGPVSLLVPLKEFETVHLIALQVMHAVGTCLEPAHDYGALPQVDVVPAQIASL